MTKKELFYFIGKCLMLDEDPGFKQEIISKIEAETIDWLKFSEDCSEHLIIPSIYLKFRSHNILDYLPEAFAEYLKYIYDLNLSRNNRILEQLHDITYTLNENNIHPVFLKGAGNLLDGLYSDIGERILGDIDFLVPEKDLLKSAKLFEAEGYLPSEPYPYIDITTWRHYPPMSKTGQVDIEIHHQLSEFQLNWFNPGIIDLDKKAAISLNGSFVPADKHKIIHNFVHSQLDNEGHSYGRVSFRDLYDLYLITKRTNLQQTLHQIKSRQKAIAYFVFAGKAFGIPARFYSKNTFSARVFKIKHDLNLCSSTFYYTNRSIVYLVKRIVIGHTTQIIMSFYSQKVRQSVTNRLKDRKWYRTRLQTYIAFFTRNKK